MRRVLAVVALLVLALLDPVERAGADPVSVELSREASASWMIPTGHTGNVTHYDFFEIDGFWTLGTDTKTAEAYAYTGTGKCTKVVHPRLWEISCWAMLQSHHLDTDGFTVDPTLRSASVRFGDHGDRYAARWTAKSGPGIYESESWVFPCTVSVPGPGGGLWQDAKATGRGFGRTFTRQQQTPFTSMQEGADTFDCISANTSPNGTTVRWHARGSR